MNQVRTEKEAKLYEIGVIIKSIIKKERRNETISDRNTNR